MDRIPVVAHLTLEELVNAYHPTSQYVPPTDPDPWVRAQKMVIAYVIAEELNCEELPEPSLEDYYLAGRQVAAPIAALAAGRPVSVKSLHEDAFLIEDALGSFNLNRDPAAAVIQRLFRAYFHTSKPFEIRTIDTNLSAGDMAASREAEKIVYRED